MKRKTLTLATTLLLSSYANSAVLLEKITVDDGINPKDFQDNNEIHTNPYKVNGITKSCAIQDDGKIVLTLTSADMSVKTSIAAQISVTAIKKKITALGASASCSDCYEMHPYTSGGAVKQFPFATSDKGIPSEATITYSAYKKGAVKFTLYSYVAHGNDVSMIKSIESHALLNLLDMVCDNVPQNNTTYLRQSVF